MALLPIEQSGLVSQKEQETLTLTIPVSKGDLPTIASFRQILVARGENEHDVIMLHIERYVSTYSFETNGRKIVSAKQLGEWSKENYGFALSREELYHYRQTRWVKDKEYFENASRKKSSFTYDLVTLKPFFDYLKGIRSGDVKRRYVRVKPLKPKAPRKRAKTQKKTYKPRIKSGFRSLGPIE